MYWGIHDLIAAAAAGGFSTFFTHFVACSIFSCK
jgi:hypothetical protein